MAEYSHRTELDYVTRQFYCTQSRNCYYKGTGVNMTCELVWTNTSIWTIPGDQIMIIAIFNIMDGHTGSYLDYNDFVSLTTG